MIFLKNISVSVSVKWMMPKFLFILKNPREVFLNLSAIDVRRFSFISIANRRAVGRHGSRRPDQRRVGRSNCFEAVAQ